MFELPATVVAQSERGAIYVLAVFASEQMSLRRHLETIVKPWLAANTPWIFQNRELLVGVYQDIDPRANEGVANILQSTLGGSWNLSMKPWEIRRDTMLDLFGKAQPFTMKPALQIDRFNARLLVEALSGRWTYENEQRDRRNLWYYVANAFSLIVDRALAGPPKRGVGEILRDFDPLAERRQW